MLTTPVKKYVLAKLAGLATPSGAYLTDGLTLGLSSTEPTVVGGTASQCNFTEPSEAAGYHRIQISGSGSIIYPFTWTSTEGAAAYTQVQNQYEIHFNVATADWGAAIKWVGIFDSSSRLLAFGPIVGDQGSPTQITVLNGHIPTIAQGQAKISLDVQ